MKPTHQSMLKFRSRKGFTLIELLVTVAIVGILASIAIPQYSTYRRRAFNALANSDLRNAITSEEAVFSEQNAYISCVNHQCADLLPSYHLNDGVLLAITTQDNGTYFSGQSSHALGDISYSYDSQNGTAIVSQ